MFVFPVKKFKPAINLIYIIERHSLSLAHTLSSGSQPKYVTFEYCWILTSPTSTCNRTPLDNCFCKSTYLSSSHKMARNKQRFRDHRQITSLTFNEFYLVIKTLPPFLFLTDNVKLDGKLTKIKSKIHSLFPLYFKF